MSVVDIFGASLVRVLHPVSARAIAKHAILLTVCCFINVSRRLTPELSHAGPRTQANPRLHGKPEALPGVGCSDLVRRANVHHSTISGHSLWAETQRRPAMSLSRQCNREPRETHERKSTANR